MSLVPAVRVSRVWAHFVRRSSWAQRREHRTTRRSSRGSSAESGPATRSGQAESADGVPLHDQRLDLVADFQLLEVLQPPLRPEQRVVGAEQHLVLQQGVGGADQLGWEVFG